MAKKRARPYKSSVRERQAEDTRRRIVKATRQLIEKQGYANMTIEAIARRAGVSAPSVYANFRSKTGILIELLDQSTFGPDYEELVQQALTASDAETSLRVAAGIARRIHEAQRATLDLLRGAGVVAPELAELEQQRERVRFDRQEVMITKLREAGRLRPGLDHRTARDVFWMFTGRDVYRMLVRERGWSPQKYQNWLADTLLRSLLGVRNPRGDQARASQRLAAGGEA